MKTHDNPGSGKLGDKVASKNHYGPHQRQHVIPTAPRTDAQRDCRSALGNGSKAWGRLLTEEQRLAWIAAGAKVRRRDSLGQSYSLTGQAHFVGINSVLACLGREMVWDPPQPVVFGPNPVRQLIISNGDGRLTLKLSVAEPLAEEIMVFGEAPCSPGRMKCRNVTYLGLVAGIRPAAP